MKKLYHQSLRGINYVLGMLLGWLGFSCDDGIGSGGGGVDEYGTPWATFRIQGKVTDAAGQPVEGIQVRAADNREEGTNTYFVADTTDASGAFFLETTGFPETQFRLTAEDIDGYEHVNYFETLTKTATFSPATDEYANPERWFYGVATKTVELILKPYEETRTEPYARYTIHGYVTDSNGDRIPQVNILKMADSLVADSGVVATSNVAGYYEFTVEGPTPTEPYRLYAAPGERYWNDGTTFSCDTLELDFSTIPLRGGKDVFLGQGSLELNITVTKD